MTKYIERHKYFLICGLIIFSFLFIAACTPGFISNADTARVTLDTGITLTAASRAVSTDVTSFKLTVTADGMATIEKTFTEASISLEVEAGFSRVFTLQASDSSGNTLFSGSTSVDLPAGETVSVVIEMEVVMTEDSLPPIPGGLGTLSFSSVTDSSVTISWTAATDDTSAQSALVYDVYRSTSSNITTVADCIANGTKLTGSSELIGVTTYTATGLSGNTSYYFNIVVSDVAGNQAAYTAANQTTVSSLYGYYITGDGSGGGGAGDYTTDYSRTATGGAGGGDNDTVVGSAGNDVIFGDGSGGGGGGEPYRESPGGIGGSGADSLYGGSGNDIIFGDGFDGEAMASGVSDGGHGGFGGGGGGGGCYYSPNGNGGDGGLLAGGGGAQSDTAPGASIYGGFSGGIDSKPSGGSASSDNMWGGNSAVPYNDTGYFTEQSLGGTGYNSFGAGGGAGFGGLNAQSQSIASGVTQSANGGQPQGGNGSDGTTTPVAYYDSDGGLYTYVEGQLSFIFSSAPGTTHGVGSGADVIDGGGGSDQLFGMGGNDQFEFELNDAGSSDTDTVWDFNRLGETDLLNLKVGGTTISASSRDSLIASQTAIGNDRQIVFTDSVSKTVTIIVKDLGRNLTSSDFVAP